MKQSLWVENQHNGQYDINVKKYPDMAKLLKDREGVEYKLRKFTIEGMLYDYHDVVNPDRDRRNDFKREKAYVNIKTKGEKPVVVMSNSPKEMREYYTFFQRANGHVLQAGLGIGFSALVLQSKPTVDSIIVIEKSKEIIDLVSPQLHWNKKIEIINADIFEWLPEEGKIFDTIYFDIWNSVTRDNWEDMKKLKSKFAKYLNQENDEAYMACWESKRCRPLDNISAEKRFFYKPNTLAGHMINGKVVCFNCLTVDDVYNLTGDDLILNNEADGECCSLCGKEL